MDSREQLHDFWRQPSPEGNDPHEYIFAVNRSMALARLIADVPLNASLLEVGCNVGRNLAYLRDAGYRSLEGIEINPHAVQILRRTFPQLDQATIHVGPAEEMLEPFPDDSIDLVFTMAVLEHIHPDSRSVFDHIARVARNLLAIEPPPASAAPTHRQYPHDVEQLFVVRGFTLVSTYPMATFPELGSDDGLHRFVAYRFVRNPPAG